MALSDIFARVRQTAEYRRAKHNAGANREMLSSLVRMRIDAKLTQADVATALGMSQQAVSKFERYDNDPRVSTIERYATAVGALITHSVDPDRGQLELGELRTRSYISFATDSLLTKQPGNTYSTTGPKRTDFAFAA